MCSRAHLLCIDIQRSYPYKGYDGRRNPQNLRAIVEDDVCVLCPYFQNVRKHYRGAVVSSVALKAELLAGLRMFIAQTADVGRIHGVSLRRMLCRISSNTIDVGNLAAWHSGRAIEQARRGPVDNLDALDHDRLAAVADGKTRIAKAKAKKTFFSSKKEPFQEKNIDRR